MKFKQYLNEEKYKYGDVIKLKPNANVAISGTYDDSPPQKWIRNGDWNVDAYESDTGMLNINLLNGPYPGAFCSWVHEKDVKGKLR